MAEINLIYTNWELSIFLTDSSLNIDMKILIYNSIVNLINSKVSFFCAFLFGAAINCFSSSLTSHWPYPYPQSCIIFYCIYCEFCCIDNLRYSRIPGLKPKRLHDFITINIHWLNSFYASFLPRGSRRCTFKKGWAMIKQRSAKAIRIRIQIKSKNVT